MKKLSICLSVFIIVLASCQQPTPEQSAAPRIPKKYTIEQLYDNLAVSAADFNTDETKVLVQNNKTRDF